MTSAREPVTRVLRTLGSWLIPQPPNASSISLPVLHLRAGIAGALAIVVGLVATAAAIVVAFTLPMPAPADEDVLAVIVGSVIILSLAALVPAATFRTSSAAWSRTLFSENDSRIRSWDRVTITFDALLVGALLAGVLTPPAITISLIGVGLIARAAVMIRRAPRHDVNMRFSAIFSSFSAGAAATIAYLIVYSLAPLLIDRMSIWPLLLAVTVALYSQLALNSLERWATGAGERWAFLRDAIDPRRLLIAGITALVAWLAFAAAVAVASTAGPTTPGREDAAGLAGLGVLVVAWAALWLASIAWWRHDARVLLGAWRAHQAEIVRRLADGSLSPDLAARAALPTATRVALATFGATRAMGHITLPDGTRRSSLAGLDRHDVGPVPLATDLAARPHREIRLGRPDRDNAEGWIVIGSWLAPGSFLIRSRDIVDEYVELATLALLSPVMAQDYLSASRAFDLMFDDRSRWPTMSAFHEAGDRLRDRADQSTQTSSLLVAVLEIDEFGALAGGKFEQAAVAQVIRTVLGNADFAGEELFVAYEGAGRIWIGLLGGPVVRHVATQLRALQQWINDHGSVSSARVDVEVSVSVSLGHATYQVDAVSFPELMEVAAERLDRDRSTRRALLGESLGYLDFTPEDITGSSATISTADLAQALAEAGTPDQGLEFALRRIIDSRTREDVALQLDASWPHAPGDLDLGTPHRLLDAAEHRLDLAVEFTASSLAAVRTLLRDTEATGAPVLVSAPALLLLPDAGAAALPNIAGRLLDRVDAARTVIVVSSVPHGSGQAFALLEDRGLRIAVVADAAAGADPDDLIGWSPWALVFPLGKDRRPTGLDPLSVQQVASALARRGTHLIAEAGSQADVDALRRAGFVWISMATGVGGQVASDPALPATESAHPVADAGHPTTA